MNGGGCGGVGQDVDEVRVHHVVVEQVKDAHSVRSVCRETNMWKAQCDGGSTVVIRRLSVGHSSAAFPLKHTGIYGIEVDVDGLCRVGVDLHHG